MTGHAGAAPHPFAEVLRLTMAAQQRSLDLAQAWSESFLGLLQEQAESNRAVFAALASSLAAMERALASQEATNRALRQSLDAHREVVERAAAAQERGARLVQAALDGVSASAKAQLDAARALVTPPGPRSEPFDPVREWNAMLQRMLEAVRPPARPGDQGSA